MAQLGPGGNLVLPGGQYGLGMLFGDPGFNLFDSGGGNQNVQAGAKGVGTGGLMAGFPDMLKWGQAGGWVGSGPKTFNPNLSNLGNAYTLAAQDPHLFNSSSIGQLMGLYGGPNTEGAYTRYNDAQGHYQRTMAPFEPVATSAMGADLGATFRNQQGFTQGARGSEYDLYRTFGKGQNAARQNPYLDPSARLTMTRAIEQGAPYDRPNPMGWVGQQASNFQQGPQMSPIASAMLQGQRNLSGGADAVTKYLTEGTSGLNNKYEAQLLADIDTEAQKTLANQLQDTQNTLAGSGLSRSGAGQRQLLDAQADIMAQANRDKMRTMAQMREAGLGREYGALGQGAGILEQALGRESQMLGQAGGMMGQEAEAEQGRRGQILGQGLGNLFQSAEGSRAAERQALQSSLGDMTQMYQGDAGRMLQALTSSDQAALSRQMGEQQMRSQGLSDWMRMMGYREQDRTNRLGEMLDMEDRMKASQAEKLASQQYYSMLPWNAYQTMITGISGGAMPSTGRQNPWSAVLPQAAGTALGNLFGGGASYDMRSLGLGNYNPQNV